MMKRKIMWSLIGSMIIASLVLVSCASGGGGGGGKSYTLTITSTAGGKVITPGEGTFTYAEGTVVNLVADADESYHFTNWTGTVAAIANINTASTTITMNGNYSITANFSLEAVEIRDWYGLDAIRNNLGGSYLLMNNLEPTTAGYAELASPTANGGKGWQPIRTFNGTFNGQGYMIKGPYISRPTEGEVGLFGAVVGTVKNIGVLNARVTGEFFVGGLVGKNYGTINNCYATGSVTALYTSGGLVGSNNYGTINNCYATGSVTAQYISGGLVGSNNYGTINNCYATGSVIVAVQYEGGLVGISYGTVNNSFWDMESSRQATSYGGTGKTTAEMKDITTFSDAGWNIITVGNPSERNPAYTWNIVDGQTYPFLSWQVV